MSTPANEPQKPLTAAQIEAWLSATSFTHMQLYLQGIEPLYTARRDECFLEMSALLREAIEEVRVISAQLREESQAARLRATETVAHSVRLLAHDTPATESQLLRIFHAGPRPEDHCKDE
jgi:predicted lipoprotein